MLSLSKNEFNVISFLCRNFSKRFTIRNLANELKISAPGAHAVLKKLEKSDVVKAERLGTGLFYEVNLDNKVARHLVSVVLLEHFDIKKVNTSGLEKESRAALSDGKNMIVITSNEDSIKDICYNDLKDVKVVCKSEEGFLEDLRNKEEDVLKVLEKGNVLFGEELIVDCIKRAMR